MLLISPAASKRFRSKSSLIDSEMAIFAARWQISVMSAPEKPWVT